MSVRNLFSIFAIFWCQVVVASGWTSVGGGDLSLDGGNPWFLGNTRKVHTCIEVSPSFSRTRAEIEPLVGVALQFWKRNFAETRNPFGVAQQEFVMDSDCSSSVDLRFQFGTLSLSQRRDVGDPSRFLALAVRTDYNREEMRGRGFIYLAPPVGPLRPERRLMPDDGIWVHDFSILSILIHETGHVFGLPHTNDIFFMSEDIARNLADSGRQEARSSKSLFPSSRASRLSSEIDQTLLEFRSVFRVREFEQSVVGGPGPRVDGWQFLGIPADAIVWKIRFRRDGFEVLAGREEPSADGPETLSLVGVASATVVAMQSDSSRSWRLYLPRERKVFLSLTESGGSVQDLSNTTYAEFVSCESLMIKGIYRNLVTGTRSPFLLRLGSLYRSEIIGALNGEPVLIH